MIKTLLGVRFRALFMAMTSRGHKNGKRNMGMVILFAFLYLYLLVAICGMMGLTFYSLAEPYHALGLDWLYFAMAGLMGLGFSVIGSVFTTQSQLYDAKDNDLLLSMPIPSRAILLSRMIPLLALNLLFSAMVIGPAMVVYAIWVDFSWLGLALQLPALLATALLAQAIACLFGWGMHLLLEKMNKSLASVLFMTAFLGIYFYIYSQAGKILNSLTNSGTVIADALKTWVWPLYAMGKSCLGQWLPALGYLAICGAAFALVYWILTLTFLKAATMQRSGRRKKKLDLTQTQVSSPAQAILRKELRKFLGCPVYLTNMGLGVIFTAAIPVAAIFLRKTVLSLIDELSMVMPGMEGFVPLFICAMLSFTVSMTCISTPSVSLEGKNIWILKSMPISSRTILDAKLRFHCRLAVPVTVLAGFLTPLLFRCSLADAALCALALGLLSALNGVVGMVAGLKWARLDYISEAYPCKQSISVAVTMFGLWGVPIGLGLLYGFVLRDLLTPTIFLALSSAGILLLVLAFYRILTTWGIRKWESL